MKMFLGLSTILKVMNLQNIHKYVLNESRVAANVYTFHLSNI